MSFDNEESLWQGKTVVHNTIVLASKLFIWVKICDEKCLLGQNKTLLQRTGSRLDNSNKYSYNNGNNGNNDNNNKH